MRYFLGISAFYHDAAACLLGDGEIVAAAQEERFSRRKYDPRFPRRALQYCLNEAGISPADVDQVAFYDKPWLKFERLLETYLTFAPQGFRSFMKAMPLWLKKKLWMDEHICKETDFEGDLVFPTHHQSHAASAFYPSPFEQAAVLTVDGVGEWATATWGTGAGRHINVQHKLCFPHSLGLLYSAFTYYTGFRVNSGEYKVMGLAPYGEPVYVDLIYDKLMDLRPDGSFRLDMEYFNYCQGLTMTSEAFHDLFGGSPREPESELTQRHMNLARSVQAVTEEIIVRMARHVGKETGERRLCLAGGVALNCVANGKLLRSGLFDDLWIQPAAGDAGGALGAALFAWHQAAEHERPPPNDADRQQGSCFGPSFSKKTIHNWLREHDFPHHQLDDAALSRQTAQALADGKVVGWFAGRMEYGPRALGHRSILGDARSPEMKATINRKIKFRESFRPFAPSCLSEDTSDYFKLNHPSPYMLLVADVQENHRRAVPADTHGLDRLRHPRSDIPAVTHVDYSARIQTVDAGRNPRFYQLLRAFKERTGCGVVVNTSMNVRGEPIVCTPADAYRCFMHTEMDILVLENALLLKEEQPDGAVPTDDPFKPAPETESESTKSSSALRRFGLTIVVPLTLLSAWWAWDGSVIGAAVFGTLAVLLALTALAAPRALAPVERAWMKGAVVLSSISTRVLLAAAFFLIITPLGLVLRLLEKDLLDLRFYADVDSYWIHVEPDGPGTRLYKPY